MCFLLFESLRSNLKFHLEYYIAKLSEIIGSENLRTPYEMRELALDNILQFCRIPGFAAELYTNYDCNLYCTNLLEDLVKLLSKNTLSATSPQTIYSVHQMSLDGLLIIVENIEKNCAAMKSGKVVMSGNASGSGTGAAGGRHSRNNSTTDKIIIGNSSEQQVKTIVHAAASGTASGGESSGIENINTFISGNMLKYRKTAEEISPTPEHLLELKNKKRVIKKNGFFNCTFFNDFLCLDFNSRHRIV